MKLDEPKNQKGEITKNEDHGDIGALGTIMGGSRKSLKESMGGSFSSRGRFFRREQKLHPQFRMGGFSKHTANPYEL